MNIPGIYINLPAEILCVLNGLSYVAVFCMLMGTLNNCLSPYSKRINAVISLVIARKGGFKNIFFQTALITLPISCAGGNSLPPELIMETRPEAYPIPDNDRNYPANPYRYIAHAGGEFDGMT